MKSLSNFFKVEETNMPLLATIYYTFFSVGGVVSISGSLLPFLSATYNLDFKTQGLLLSFFQVGSLMSVIIIGFLPFLIGRKTSITTLFSGIPIGLLILSLTGNVPLLLFAFIAMGIGRGGISNISTVTISEISRDKATSLSVLHSFFALGALISPFLVMLVTKRNASNWKIAPITFAVLGITAVLLLSRATIPNHIEPRTANNGGMGFLKERTFWVNTLLLFFYICSEASITGWLVTYFTDNGLISGTIALLTPSILWLSILIGRLACVALSKKFASTTLLIWMAGLNVLFFLMMINTLNPTIVMVALVGFGVSMSGIYPVAFSTMDEKHTSSTVATGFCIAITSIGGIIMPAIIGFVANSKGIVAGVATIAVPLCLMLALSIYKMMHAKKTVR